MPFFWGFKDIASDGDGIGELTIIPTTVARFPITVKNLTPGTIYIFQVRAANNLGRTDWSDPVTFIGDVGPSHFKKEISHKRHKDSFCAFCG
jgi:hypothetical protein